MKLSLSKNCGLKSCYEKSVEQKQLCRRIYEEKKSSSVRIKGFFNGTLSLDFGTVFVLIVPLTLLLTILDIFIVGFISLRFLDDALENIIGLYNKESIIIFISVAFFAGSLVPLSTEKFSPKNFCILNRSEQICLKEDIKNKVDCYLNKDAESGRFDQWLKIFL